MVCEIKMGANKLGDECCSLRSTFFLMTSISTKEHPSSPSELANVDTIMKKYKIHPRSSPKYIEKINMTPISPGEQPASLAFPGPFSLCFKDLSTVSKNTSLVTDETNYLNWYCTNKNFVNDDRLWFIFLSCGMISIPISKVTGFRLTAERLPKSVDSLTSTDDKLCHPEWLWAHSS